MISVVIPTLNAEDNLPATLNALVPAALEGVVREVIVADGGSKDRTREIADHAGAEVVTSAPSRGAQLAAGAARARHPWLMFLNADTVLDADWQREACHFMERVDTGKSRHTAAAFRFALDDDGAAPRTLEVLARLRCVLFRLPYGEQGLLVTRRAYDRTGGYRDVALLEDVDIVRRLGPSRVKLLRARALTSPGRYRADGYLRHTLKNQVARMLHALNVRPATREQP